MASEVLSNSSGAASRGAAPWARCQAVQSPGRTRLPSQVSRAAPRRSAAGVAKGASVTGCKRSAPGDGGPMPLRTAASRPSRAKSTAGAVEVSTSISRSRMERAESRQARDQPAQGPGRVAAHAQRRRRPAPSDAVAARIVPKASRSARGITRAGLGRLHGIGATMQQRDAERRLEFADAPADRGLRHVQPRRGRGEAAVLGHQGEGVQRRQGRQAVHARP